MSTTTDLYREGKLQEAIDAQIQAVKSKPADQSLRLFLFELLSFAGEFERAKKQIDVLKFDEPELAAAALNYRQCLDSETTRQRVFKEGIAPGFLKPPSDHLKLRVEALQRLRTGDAAGAKAKIAEAAEKTPGYEGTINDKPFTHLHDWDDLLGPVLEVYAKGNYFWVPFEDIELLASNPPKFPRDLIWMPANLQLKDGQTGDVFLPALYPATGAANDPLVKLGRMTDVIDDGVGPVRCVGARMWFVDDEDLPFLEIRQLTAAEPSPESVPAAIEPIPDA